ncbi:DNA-directed RNA polymerase II subunit RPB11 [Hypomontagnella monticulosa]|nr:DNA-directed RNA polymerase II subunit RPB11 [Hypomontagnella monticulosa]
MSAKHDNVSSSFELFLLNEGAGEKKITEKPFAGMSNTSDFIILKEDHTIGNLLSEHFKLHPHVMMAGYKGNNTSHSCNLTNNNIQTQQSPNQEAVAHPNVPEVLIRLQTDGTVTPREVFVDVCKQLVASLGQLAQNFTREYELRRMATAGDHDNAPGGGAGGKP